MIDLKEKGSDSTKAAQRSSAQGRFSLPVVENVRLVTEEELKSPPRPEQDFVLGTVETSIGPVPRIFADMRLSDRLGEIKVRWGVGRMKYKVDPGLYALGEPNDQSPVLVTANYKLSFDHLRRALSARNAWILVLNTEGINVWCAAGKGTFGTNELIRRVEADQVKRVVSHRELILPQLAAPGVSAYEVRRSCGFKVTYGPIRAGDLPAFLDRGRKATPEMRRKTFTVWERVVLIPVELVGAMKPGLGVMTCIFLLGGLGAKGTFWANATTHGLFGVWCFLGGIFAGAVMTPVFLPWLPGRAFSVKGILPGLFVASILLLDRLPVPLPRSEWMEMAGWGFLIPALSTYVAMNFTGASTYTSLSGVKKEMRWAVPLQVAAGLVGITLWLISRFMR